MPHVKSNFAPHRDKFGNTLIEEGLPCPAEGYLHNNGFNGLHTLTGVQICKTMNLDLDNGEPIGRMHDGELWFRVRVKDPSEPFNIAVNGYGSLNYDWDISIDGADLIRETGSKSTTPISLPMSVGKHYVKITPHNGVTAGWARCLGGGGGRGYWNDDVGKIEFGLEWLPGYAFMESEDNVGTEFLFGTLSSNSSLTSMPHGFNLPQNITSVGNNFLAYTWEGCVSLTSIPNGFNIPQGITSVGGSFLRSTWANCTLLTSMPSGFNIPQNIMGSANLFLNSTWFKCTSLTSMPSGFNIPQGITSVEDDFLELAWYGCASLTSMPHGFNLPQNITSVGDAFLKDTWYECTSLTSMPSGFNLPENITSVGVTFLSETWYGCTSLTSMPSGFNIPQGITSVGDKFLYRTWQNCSLLTSIPSGFDLPQGITSVGNDSLYFTWFMCQSLTSNSPSEPIRFPNVSGSRYAEGCFGFTPIFPSSPTPGSSVMVHRG